MSALWRLVRKFRPNLLWLTAAVLAAVLLHIGTVLTVMHFGTNSAFAALAQLGPVNQMTVLEPVSAGHQPLPFLSPAERYAICRFDLRKGPVALDAKLGGDDWMIAVYSSKGVNEFAISGADLDRRDVEVVLTARDDGLGPPLPIAKDGSVSTAISLTDRTGIAVVSAPATRAAYIETVQQLLSGATCTLRARAGAG